MTDEMSSIIEFDADISQQEAPEPLPVGTYSAQITEVESKVSQSGNKYAAVSFYVSVDDFPADYPVENNPDGVRLVYRRASLMDTNQGRYGLRKFCESIGAPMSTRIDLNDWVGLEATVEVDHDEWNGDIRANIVKVETA